MSDVHLEISFATLYKKCIINTRNYPILQKIFFQRKQDKAFTKLQYFNASKYATDFNN